MKIVLDTTILVRANERSHGLARELLLNVVESKHTLLFSNEMLHELARVLRYPRLQAFYDLTENLVFKREKPRRWIISELLIIARSDSARLHVPGPVASKNTRCAAACPCGIVCFALCRLHRLCRQIGRYACLNPIWA